MRKYGPQLVDYLGKIRRYVCMASCVCYEAVNFEVTKVHTRDSLFLPVSLPPACGSEVS